MKHNKIIISILTIFIILLSVGCSNKQENIPDSNENINADYDSLFQELEEKYDATLGIYALDTETNKEISYNADERFAYCSTYKALAAGAILEKYSIEELDNVIYFEEEDVLSYAPVAKDKVDTGMTIREICDAAVRQSDNTAGNLQFTLLDGPNGFKQSLSKIGDTVSEPSRIETELNDAVPGDIRDTSTPKQLAFNLKEYVTGDILSDDKKEIFIDWMSNNATGDELIRAGVPSDWIVADKSGAGSYGTRNDIAIVTPPNKKPIFVAVLSKKAEQDAEYDNKLIADATKIIFDLIS